jgi:hypothetical protein
VCGIAKTVSKNARVVVVAVGDLPAVVVEPQEVSRQ